MARLDYRNLASLVVMHALALAALVYLALGCALRQSCVLALVLYLCCGLSITGGYHRLFTHRAYHAAWPVRVFYLLFGAASLQNSALRWCRDHRAHHADTDGWQDPYNIARGFLWAHIGWVIFRGEEAIALGRVRDLATDPLVRLQDRYYLFLAFVTGFALPGVLGWLWNDISGVLLIGGCLRVVLQWHATFAVNSIAHTIGRRPYAKVVSARDSWFTALVTFGEGYHNYHHRFPWDYRNGVRWYQFDPTKWFIWALSKLRLAEGLRRVSPGVVERVRASVMSCETPSAPAPPFHPPRRLSGAHSPAKMFHRTPDPTGYDGVASRLRSREASDHDEFAANARGAL